MRGRSKRQCRRSLLDPSRDLDTRGDRLEVHQIERGLQILRKASCEILVMRGVLLRRGLRRGCEWEGRIGVRKRDHRGF